MTKKRGAPRGNKNALKHGFYSRAFTPAENAALDKYVLGQFKDESALMRILIARTVKRLQEQGEELSFEDEMAALRVITLAVGRLESMTRSSRVYFGELSDLEKQVEEGMFLARQYYGLFDYLKPKDPETENETRQPLPESDVPARE